MKVVHVVLSLDCGGLEHLVLQLAQSLKKRNIESEIICLQGEGVLEGQAQTAGIKVFRMNKKEGFEYGLIFKLAQLLKQQKADVIHTHNMAPLIYGTLASLMTGIPCINTRHGRTPLKTYAAIWRLNKYIVAVSKDCKTELLKHNRIGGKRVKVIYNGIDISAFSHVLDEKDTKFLKESIGLRPGSFVIGHIGRLSPEKDQESLLKAVRKLVQKKMDVELVVVGDGALRGHLEKKAREYGIDGAVKFLGYRDDVAKLLHIFDVKILSSITEGVSLTLLETMAARKPVIATAIGGNPEVVIDDETGYLVPCGFPERIEAAVMRLFAKRELIRKMGNAGRKRVEGVFSLEAMTNEYEKLYRGIAK